MLMSCRRCGGPVKQKDSNGVVDPDKKRIEWYKCRQCGHGQKVEIRP
jgi:primosomal protein N'